MTAFRHVTAQVIFDTKSNALLERCRKLLRHLPKPATTISFTDFKNFFLNPPVNGQNNCIWAVGKKHEVDENCLLVQTVCATPHFMVSTGVCFNGKGGEGQKANVNTKLYVDTLLLKLVAYCKTLLPTGFIFTARCTLVQSAVLRSHVVCLSVCLSVCL